MKIQEQIINKEAGSSCWKITFEHYIERPLTLKQWEFINNIIEEHLDNAEVENIYNKNLKITDEVIEKASQHWNQTTNPDMWTFKLAWKAGAKWVKDAIILLIAVFILNIII